MNGANQRFDITAIRRRLAESSGRTYWRGLEELAETDEFREILEREFPSQAGEWIDPVGRRRFLKLMGASLALAGVTACTRQPEEKIAPFAQAPENLVPGRPVHYATALTLSGIATGALVETHEGRPTKVEGNPDHPESLGSSDIFMQAAILGLYDPDRSRTVTHLGQIRPWGDLLGMLKDVVEAQAERKGAGLRILTGTVTSPTLAAQIAALMERLPEARWHQYEPVNRDNAREGARLAFGETVAPAWRVREADVIVSLDADFLAPGPGSLRHIREFVGRRQPERMNRLYVIEAAPTITGAKADHRLPLAPGDIEPLARALAVALGLPVAPPPDPDGRLDRHDRWIAAVANDLKRRGSSALVIAGDRQPPAVHALAHAINDALGGSGRTVVYTDPVEAWPSSGPATQIGSLRLLAGEMEAGSVEALLVLGCNPVYSAPADIPFGDLMDKVGLRVHVGTYADETAILSHWHVPEAHELESWGDARAADGTVTIRQPMIQALYGGRTAHEMVATLMDQAGKSAYDIVREHWKSYAPANRPFEAWWQRALHDGMVPGTSTPERRVSLRPDWADRAAGAVTGQRGRGLEISIAPDPSVHDGRFANNGWLQELPRPITRLTWDNAALIAPAMAERLGLENEDVVDLAVEGRSVRAPVWIVPGHPDTAVTLHLGYGRRRAGRVGEGPGVDVTPLRTSSAPWFAAGLSISAAGTKRRLACTQLHHSMEGRHHARAATLGEYLEHPDFAQHVEHGPDRSLSLYPEHKYEGHAWGMAIDLNACIGCNACVIGCQAENNIPVVGREQVAVGREMHWIRVDRYFEGSLDNPAVLNQPVPCMHCEEAPCEPVCPVGATVHSSEGLNDMVYNRCVGTRYCSNNCPYKVRRFNFLLYQDFETPSLKLMRNPDVTVRSRGVMEKCTYCVQRINEARIDAHREDRGIRDGDIRTACQQACPAEAIVFGDINDPESRVSRLKAGPRDYSLLGDLNTRPRTTYLAGLSNPNPEIGEA